MQKIKTIYLASPRGFCAGVRRSLDTVNEALNRFGAPIYVLHEIVHNDYIVDSLKSKGVLFVESLAAVPEGAVLIFSAHGVARSVEEMAESGGLKAIDATCPLVKKIHRKARKLQDEDITTILIGHKKHREVIGTAGQLDTFPVIVETVEDVKELPCIGSSVTYLTQTTLSESDVSDIVDALRDKFPQLEGSGDICYATKNRQNAVKELADKCDVIFIIGSKKSSNSQRLREVGEKYGCDSYLVNTVDDLKENMYEDCFAVGVSAGASAPEVLVDDVVEKLGNEGWNRVETVSYCEENLEFPLPDIS